MAQPTERLTCRISNVGLDRQRRPRWWCDAHGANATGPGGSRLHVCNRVATGLEEGEVLELDPKDFRGGIAVWGALPAVYDTTGLPPDSGLHVHARRDQKKHKEIDCTVAKLLIPYQRDLIASTNIELSEPAAVSFYLSFAAQQKLICEFCPHCQTPHLDAGVFAVRAHRRHLCNSCGRHFVADQPAVSNPIALVEGELKKVGWPAARSPIQSTKALDIRQSDYPGGVQIWASNPAVIWTSEKAQDAGIHVHLYGANGDRVEDETFGSVTVDGMKIHEPMVRLLMAQNALPQVRDRVVALNCTNCGQAHFDVGACAFLPHERHQCENCGFVFRHQGRLRTVVSNPLVSTIAQLHRSSAEGRGLPEIGKSS